ESYSESWVHDGFVAGIGAIAELGDVGPAWEPGTPLRVDYDRWLAMCEIDAIVSLLLGLSDVELVQMYRSQFGVLRKNENVMLFDAKGRQICGIHHAWGSRQARWEADLRTSPAIRGETNAGMWDRVQAHLAGDTSVDLGPFAPPFRPADR